MTASPARPSKDLHSPDQVDWGAELHARRNNLAEGILSEYEIFWRDHYSWLKDEAGYLLRPRYSPTWTPAWKTPDKYSPIFEDSLLLPSASLIDATRVSDGSYVVLKRPTEARPCFRCFREAQLFQKFSSEPLAADPKNHCIRLIDILQVPDDSSTDLIVMPLMWSWEEFPFLTIGEAGLQFLHPQHLARANSIVMDAAPILREDPHPWNPHKTRDFSRNLRPVRTRTQNPVKYYWIDFDLSDEHDPSKGPPLVNPGYGGIRNVPEFSFKDKKCNPFAVDVWCLGFLVQVYFTKGSDFYETKKMLGFEFMDELVADMVQEDPAKRPSMDEVVRRFTHIKARLSRWKLRSPFTSNSIGIVGSTRHWVRQLYFMARRISAIPTP
ncbi:hypothetical protein B0H14DRAFT_3034218 [Mycena olivaceomarginata]|nr:hypothetical protein B0H14DRAFT_3034218 [Mycena olivaceomarginata]